MSKQLTLPTPGEILATEFLEPLGLTQYRLAKEIHVPQTRIAAIIKEGRSISADTALRLARFFGTSVEFWLNLQSQYDADIARALVRRDPSERADAEIVLDGAVGSLLADHGDPRAALPYLERQLAFFDDGHDPSNLVAALQALADARASLGDHDEASRLAARAVATSSQTLGDDHPSTLVSITVQTEVLVRAGRGDRAAEAEAIATAALARPPDVVDESTRAVFRGEASSIDFSHPSLRDQIEQKVAAKFFEDFRRHIPSMGVFTDRERLRIYRCARG